ncbi:hypothetical protein [Vibrio cholerae]|uniref:hypothetical protein n=1 Tax=Vibrio cholerae TaxID=666 RepID=UPI00068136FF|nr:hypothetical protein [Vibrio cholerae]
MNITALSCIVNNISEINAKALEMGEAQISIEPTHTDSGKCLVVFVNNQAVYAPTAQGRMDTYTACAEEIERYMNSY